MHTTKTSQSLTGGIHSHTENAHLDTGSAERLIIDCAILRSRSRGLDPADCLVLAIASREGRGTAQLIEPKIKDRQLNGRPEKPMISWRGEDGVIECLSPDIPASDVVDLLREIQGHGLLVSSIRPESLAPKADGQNQPEMPMIRPRYWILKKSDIYAVPP